MWPETSNALMGALLLHDIRNSDGPATADVGLRNPLELFSLQGVHGGLWRVGYALNSTSYASVLAFLFINYFYIVVPAIAFLCSAVGWLFGIPFLADQGWDPLGNYVLRSSFGVWVLG